MMQEKVTCPGEKCIQSIKVKVRNTLLSSIHCADVGSILILQLAAVVFLSVLRYFIGIVFVMLFIILIIFHKLKIFIL